MRRNEGDEALEQAAQSGLKSPSLEILKNQASVQEQAAQHCSASSWDVAELFTWQLHNRLVCCYSLLILMLFPWVVCGEKKHPLFYFVYRYVSIISLFPCRSCRKQGSREGGRDPELPDVCEDEATS